MTHEVVLIHYATGSYKTTVSYELPCLQCKQPCMFTNNMVNRIYWYQEHIRTGSQSKSQCVNFNRNPQSSQNYRLKIEHPARAQQQCGLCLRIAAQYILLFLVMVQICIIVTCSHSSHLFLCALATLAITTLSSCSAELGGIAHRP